MHLQAIVVVGLILLSLGAAPLGAQQAPSVRITTKNGTPRELATKEQLESLLERFDVDQWILTREVLIDENSIPHSHPVLTIHTRALGNDDDLLATFLHEQFHWWLIEQPLARKGVAAFAEMFPVVPVGNGEGAGNEHSTRLHLVVCDLEYAAMTRLVGEERARSLLEGKQYYRWIYGKVLDDPRIRETNARYGLTLGEQDETAGTAGGEARRAPGLRMTFVPQSDTFAAAAAEYTRIWASDGERIVRTMEEVSGLAFEDTAVVAVVFEGASFSGYRERPMHLRASYPEATKRATLIHELGHRLQTHLFRRDEEPHEYLFLWLYDVWVALYGREFADEQVEVEKRRGRMYPAAWERALSLSAEERAARWRATVRSRTR